MADRILNRRELRKQTTQADQANAAEAVTTASPPKASARRKGAAAPKTTKPHKSKMPPRMRALWCVNDGGMKEIALFDYNQRAAAEAKLAALQDKHKGPYFLQIVKQPMPAAASRGRHRLSHPDHRSIEMVVAAPRCGRQQHLDGPGDGNPFAR